MDLTEMGTLKAIIFFPLWSDKVLGKSNFYPWWDKSMKSDRFHSDFICNSTHFLQVPPWQLPTPQVLQIRVEGEELVLLIPAMAIIMGI